jgi:hypothetical protein
MGALAFGTIGTSIGWGGFLLYREPFDAGAASYGVTDQAEHAAVEARAEAWVQAADRAKRRGWPLSVATLLLGIGVFVFALRALGRRSGARSALVQLVIAQAGINVAHYWLMRDVIDPYSRFAAARQTALTHEPVAPEVVSQSFPVLVGFSTFGSALIVLGLTRRRSRGFLDASGEPIEEP